MLLIDVWSTFGVLQKGLQRISTQVNAESSEVPLQLLIDTQVNVESSDVPLQPLIDTFDGFGNKLSQSNNKELQYIH